MMRANQVDDLLVNGVVRMARSLGETRECSKEKTAAAQKETSAICKPMAKAKPLVRKNIHTKAESW